MIASEIQPKRGILESISVKLHRTSHHNLRPRFSLLLLVAAVSFWGIEPTAATSNTPSITPTDTPSNEIYSPDLFAALSFRLVGPHRGGRVTTVTGDPINPFTFYFGSTGGGVWKTHSAGERWENISDDQIGVGSIGAVAIAPSDRNVLYVGTGSACPRGNVSAGDGIYKSTDAGKTWQHIGLPEAGQIGRILVHPERPDTVYAAALGHIFGPNAQRGIYKSVDGGSSWQLALSVSSHAGGVDLAMNPKNPRELFAAIWQAERKPWTMIDGGEDSGLYKSIDAGESWTRLTDPALANGLPSGLLGRIGVEVSPIHPSRVWAIISTPDDAGGLFRSDDSGKTWARKSDDHRLTTRAWYYSHVRADPVDPDTVYISNVQFLKSIDGGTSFERIRAPHGDFHDLWINPATPSIMVQGSDGGATVTLDGGKTWSDLNNQPTAEFYRVAVDNQFPYRLYGAQQDNSTISVPSWAISGLAPEQLWFSVGGGESGHIAVHPENPDIIYAGTFIGRIDRYDRKADFARDVVIYPQMQDGTAPRDLKYRFQWNAPIRFSPHDPEIIYHTSNFVHRSTDGGMNWETISPDLTRNEPDKQLLPGGPIQHDHTGVEVYNTIFAFEESPFTPGLLWAGSDDGLLHISRDDGATWTNITPPSMEIDSTVNDIALSPHREGSAIIAVHRYRVDDFRPYIWKTDDFGATWTSLTDGTNGIPDNHPVRAVVEDPDREGLIYAGTEFGLFVSFDGGNHWQTLQLNLPPTPITDLEVHEKDLVVATQGRSFWILDDLTLLHQLSESVAEEPVFLFEPAPAYLIDTKVRFDDYQGPQGQTDGAVLYYWIAEEPEGTGTLDILSLEGDLVRSITTTETPPASTSDGGHKPDRPTLPAKKGLNRFVWDLEKNGPDLIEGSFFSLADTGGYKVLPGTYTLRLTIGDPTIGDPTMDDRVLEQPLSVLMDPRLTDVELDDLRAQHALLDEIAETLNLTHNNVRALRSVRSQLRLIATRIEESGYTGDWKPKANDLIDQLTAIEDELIQTRAETNQDLLNHPPRLDDQLAYLYTHVAHAYGRPSQGSYERLEDLRSELTPHLEALDTLYSNELRDFNESLRTAGVPSVLRSR